MDARITAMRGGIVRRQVRHAPWHGELGVLMEIEPGAGEPITVAVGKPFVYETRQALSLHFSICAVTVNQPALLSGLSG